MSSPALLHPSLKRIVLTGFMGSGKTTVGRLLAAALEWQFADLDEVVEEQLGRSVPQIFAEQGEEAFREAETRALAALVQRTPVVIALGGGAAATAANRDLLRATPATAVVHLDAPFPVLYARCAAQSADPAATVRPLLGDPETAAARYHQRSELYRTLAHHGVDAGASPQDVVGSILAALRARLDPTPC